MKKWFTWLMAVAAGLVLVGCQSSQVLPDAAKTADQPVPVATASVVDDADMAADVADVEEDVAADVEETVADVEEEVVAEAEAEAEETESMIEEATDAAADAVDAASAAVAGAAAAVMTGLRGDAGGETAPVLEDAISIDSSAIDSVSYNADEQVLSVVFPNGDIYDYANFAPEVFEEFMNADSKGAFFVNRIKDQFEAVKR